MKIASILLCWGLGLVGGCASVESQWQATQQQDTVTGYEAFVTQHPDADQAAIARNIISDEEEFDHSKDLGTSAAIETYLEHFPSGRHLNDAHKIDESLAYKEASAANTIDAMEKFLAHFPTSSFSSEVLAELRPLRFQNARQSADEKLCEEFLKQYPEGKDSDELRQYVASIRLGLACIGMAPKWDFQTDVNSRVSGQQGTTFTEHYNAHIVYESSPALAASLSSLRELLNSGADPSTVHIAGYSKATENPFVVENHQQLLANTLVTVSTPLVNGGDPGHLVPAKEGGMTLLEYCKANGLADAYKLLESHLGK